MGFLRFLKKSKAKRPVIPEELDIPPAPPTEELPAELPTFPTPEEAHEIRAKPPEEEAPEITRFVEEKEEKAYEAEKEGLEERSHLELTKPIFIKADLFKGVCNEISLIKNTLKESEDTSMTLEDLENDGQREFEKWHLLLEDIQKKLIFADKNLFGKEV